MTQIKDSSLAGRAASHRGGPPAPLAKGGFVTMDTKGDQDKSRRGDMDAQVLAAQSLPTAIPTTTQDKLERHLAFWSYHLTAHGKSGRTIGTYQYAVGLFSRWAKESNSDYLTLSEKDAESFIEYLYSRKLSTSSARLHAGAVKQFYRWLLRQRAVILNPFADLPSIKVRNRARDWLSVEEMQSLISKCREGLDVTVLELLYGSGLRNAELRGLKVGDVHLDECLVRITGKGGDEEYQLITPRAAQALREYLSSRKGSPRDPLFLSTHKRAISDSTLGRIVREAGKNAGLSKPVYPHLMRHTYATHLLENGADLREVQELLRHVNIATTIIYAHVSKPRLKSVLNRCHPLANKDEGAE